MENVLARTVFDVLTDFLAANPTPNEILQFFLPADLQGRADTLVERNREGLITYDEQQELVDFLRADEMVALLKAKTKLKIRNSAS